MLPVKLKFPTAPQFLVARLPVTPLYGLSLLVYAARL